MNSVSISSICGNFFNTLLSVLVPPVIIKQQVRLERLRIELVAEKGRLVAIQRDIAVLEKPNNPVTSKADAEVEKQLQKEIRHLRGQCERLSQDVDRHSEVRGKENMWLCY